MYVINVITLICEGHFFFKSLKRVVAKAPKKDKLLFITIVPIKLFDYKKPKPNKLLIQT